MSRALAPRLRRLEGQIGWRLITLQKPNGEELIVRAETLIDAWLRVVLDGEVPNLAPHVSRFLADAKVGPRHGEFLVSLKHECRAIWFPDEARTAQQRIEDEDERALDVDPPAFVPASSPVAERVRGGSSRP